MNVTVIFDSSRVNVDMTPVTFSVMPAKGDKGDDGEPGPAGTIENLTVASETLTPGATPTVSYENNTITFGQSAGVGITSYTEYYARSTSKTTAPGDSSFSTTPPSLTTTYKYMWAYTVIAYNNNTTTTTTKHLIGAYGDTGTSTGVAWGSITGTLSSQTDLNTALGNKADASDTYTKAQVDAKIEKPVPKTLTFSSVNWSASTWSAAAVDAGATSGGDCYVATYSSESITLYNRFIPEHAVGYTGAVYVTPVSGGFRVEAETQPASSNEISGVVVNTDVYVANGVAAAIMGDPASASDVYTKSQSAAVELFNDTVTLNSGTYNLSEDARNFMYIVVEAKANIEVQYQIVPYSALSSENYINFSVFGAASFGQVTSMANQAKCDIVFASDYQSFEAFGAWNNDGFKIIPTKIWGVFRRAT